MRKKIEWQWEKLDEATYRAKVIGGWLVLHCKYTTIMDGKKRDMVQSESMSFVADRDHEWHVTLPFNPSDPSNPIKNKVNPDDFAVK